MSIDKKTLPLLGTTFEPAPPAYEVEESLVARTATLAQPTATPQMSIGGTRNPKSLPVGLDGKRSFNHHLCACHERPMLTLAACCCPCSIWASNHTRLTHLAKSGEPNPSPERVGLFCCLYAVSPNLLGIGQVVMQCFSRFQTRERYAIRGSPVEDVLIGAFFPTCSLVQESREIEEEEQALREGGAAPETFYRDEEEQIEA
ncbi:PLAC8 family-domain-containing protein [Leucosporidium creatinivorum]|uniref:PLAC8 family-domain-containing protein n=1 Tax=Leucosporidium creatinivorum TaxID=106004 RepID=A0A1Y2G163_9BASI|nr:PLAC8 family-domain-containing protein [Leucosporidium creatinivorum]